MDERVKLARLARRPGPLLAIASTVAAAAAFAFAAPARLRFRAPSLARPLSEGYPDPTRPADPVKAAVFQRINADRARFGADPVLWDEAASRLSDAFCARQVQEKTRGHFLTDGLPPYARMSFGGVFALSSENSISWVTTGRKFDDPTIDLALQGESEMMAEKPPADGHRVTILDPEATHVGVGYAIVNGRFQMSQEFLTRALDRVTIGQIEGTLSVSGRPRSGYLIRFLTIARESPPRPLTREEASSRTSYSYPSPYLAYVPEGHDSLRVVGTTTEGRLRALPGGEVDFSFRPDRAGLYTFEFYVSRSLGAAPRPGAAATIWVE